MDGLASAPSPSAGEWDDEAFASTYWTARKANGGAHLSEESMRWLMAKRGIPYLAHFQRLMDEGKFEKKTAGTALAQPLAKYLPFVGAATEGVEVYDLLKAAKAVERGDATPEQDYAVWEYQIDMLRPQSGWYKFWDLVTDLPAPALEFAAGGAGAARLLGTGIKEAAESKARSSISKKLADFGIRAAVSGAARVPGGAAQRALNEGGIQITEDEEDELQVAFAGKTGELLDNIPEAVVSQLWETASEMSGALFADKVAKADVFAHLVRFLHVKAFSSAAAREGSKKAMDLLRKGGYQGGGLAESLEEVVGGLGRAASDYIPGLDMEETFRGALPETFEDAFIQYMAFSVPGAVASTAGEARAHVRRNRPAYFQDQAAADAAAADLGLTEYTFQQETPGGPGVLIPKTPPVDPQGGVLSGEENPGNQAGSVGGQPIRPITLGDLAESQAGPAEEELTLSGNGDSVEDEVGPTTPSAADVPRGTPEPLGAPVLAQVERFAPGGSVVEPTPELQEAARQAEAMGTRVVFVQPGEAGIQGEGVSYAPGAILVDATRPDPKRIILHEIVHEISRSTGQEFSHLQESIREILGPDGVAKWEQAYIERGGAATGAQLAEEGVADYASSLASLIDVMSTPEGASLARRIAVRDRSLWEKIVDAVRRLVRGTEARDRGQQERLLRDLEALRRATGAEVARGDVLAAGLLKSSMAWVAASRAAGSPRVASGQAGAGEASDADQRLSPGHAPFEGGRMPEDAPGRVRRGFALGSQPKEQRGNVSGDPNVREVMDAVDAVRNEEGQPYRDSIESAEKQAGRLIEEHGADALRKHLKAKSRSGQGLDLIETLAARRLLADATQEAIASGDAQAWSDAVESGWQYREARAEQARTLGMVRDLWPKTAREELADVLSQPTYRQRRYFNRLAKKRRDLSSAAAAAKGEVERKALQSRIKEIEGDLQRELARDAKRMAQATKKLSEEGIDASLVTMEDLQHPATRRRIAAVMTEARSDKWDWFLAWRYNSMLSWAGTHARNIAGNTVNATMEQGLQRAVEGVVAGVIRKSTGKALPNSPFLSEFKVMAPAIMRALREASRNGSQGYLSAMPATEMWLQRKGVPIEGAASKIEHATAMQMPSKRLLYLDYLGTRALQGADDFAKTAIITLEVEALALRQAMSEGLTGDALMERRQELLLDPNSDIHEKAYGAARKTSFQEEPGWLAQHILNLRTLTDQEMGVPIGSMILPFVTTPTQIFKAGMRKVPPIALMKIAIKSNPLRRTKSDGYATQQEQLVTDVADLLIGSGMFWAISSFMMGDEGDEPRITGSRDRWGGRLDLQYRTFPPMSFRVGDKWYSYAGLEPLATMLAPSVDAIDGWWTAAESGDADRLGAAASSVSKSVLSSVQDKTFLRTMGELVQLIESDGESVTTAGFARDLLVTPMVPNVIRGAARESDEYLRLNTFKPDGETTPMGMLLSGDMRAWGPVLPLPNARWTPPPKRDVWGRPIPRAVQLSLGSLTVLPHLFKEAVPPAQRLPIEKADLVLRAWNRKVLRGEAGEDAQVYYPPTPNVSRDWTPEEIDQLVREAGELAQNRVRGIVLDPENPTEQQVASIKKAISRSYNQVRSRIKKQRRGVQ